MRSLRRLGRHLRRASTSIVRTGDAESTDDMDAESGAVFVLAAAILVVLMGMAGFAVDLGWLYLQGSRAQSAAEAAALAGVVHMPRQDSGPWQNSPAFTVARDIASANGFAHGVDGVAVSPTEFPMDPARRNQLEVRVDQPTDTFFMRLFGLDTVTISRFATAEFLPQIKLGNDQSWFGNQPPGGDPGATNPNFWVATNGEWSPKTTGDPFSTRCLENNVPGGVPPPPGGSTGLFCDNQNAMAAGGEFRDPAHYYAIEVDSEDVGSALTVRIWDANWKLGAPTNATPNSVHVVEPSSPGYFYETIYTVYEPDETPGDPTDNTTIASSCGVIPYADPDPDLDPGPGLGVWETICTTTATSGVYVLEIRVNNGAGTNGFSIDVSTSGPGDPAVYGIGAMSLYMIQADVTANFKLAKLEEIYAGRQLDISLFDAGDIGVAAAPPGWEAAITIAGEGLTYGCEYRVRNALGVVIQNWTTGGTPCRIVVSEDGNEQIYNNQWLDMRFAIPTDYTCSSDCWWEVDFDVPAGTNPTERTTWVADVGGTPIRLIDAGRP